jgi:hypothetical protein
METALYFVVGPALAVLAVLISFLGLRSERFGASTGAFRAIAGGMGILVVITLVGAVLNARHEHEEKAKEYKEYFSEHKDAASKPTQGE